MRKSGSETVLVVDDEPEVLDFIKEALLPLGYKVLLSASAEEALNLSDEKKKEVDLLLADVLLPGIKGHELAEMFRGVHPDIKLLFMSGYMCPSLANKSTGDREEAFLKKPFSCTTLVDKMRKVLR